MEKCLDFHPKFSKGQKMSTITEGQPSEKYYKYKKNYSEDARIEAIKETNENLSFNKKTIKPLQNSNNTGKVLNPSCQKSLKNKNNLQKKLNLKEKIIKRPASTVNRSYLNQLELFQKVRSIQRQPSPSSIDNLIKKSLIQAKKTKKDKDKAAKQSFFIKDIKKKELSYQNKQIRIQNYLKLKNKKLKKRNKDSKINEISNIYTLKTDTSNKLKKNDSVLTKSDKKNVRSSTSHDYYHLQSYDNSALPIFGDEKFEKNPVIERNLHRQRAKENSDNLIQYIKSFQNNSKNQSLSSIEISSNEKSLEESDIEKNFSFISDKNGENVGESSEFRIQPLRNRNLSENIREDSVVLNRLLNDSFENSKDSQDKISYKEPLTEETFTVFSYQPQKRKNHLHIQNQGKILIQKMQTPQKLCLEHLRHNTISINSLAKCKLSLKKLPIQSFYPSKKSKKT